MMNGRQSMGTPLIEVSLTHVHVVYCLIWHNSVNLILVTQLCKLCPQGVPQDPGPQPEPQGLEDCGGAAAVDEPAAGRGNNKIISN